MTHPRGWLLVALVATAIACAWGGISRIQDADELSCTNADAGDGLVCLDEDDLVVFSEVSIVAMDEPTTWTWTIVRADYTEAGRLSFGPDGRLRFEGDAEESAHLFFAHTIAVYDTCFRDCACGRAP